MPRGSRTEDARAKLLLAWTAKNQMILINDGKESTSSRHRHESHVEITVTTTTLRKHMKK